MKVVEEAKAGKQDIRFHFDSECEPDCPVSEMAKFFGKEWRDKKTIPPGVTTVVRQGGNNPTYYHAVPIVVPGMVRPHRISFGGDDAHPNERLTGGFLEQRGSDRGTPAKDGSMEYLPSLKLTVNAFPQKLPARPGPHGTVIPETTDAALNAARVNFSMAMICQALAGLHEPPTKDKPLIIDGSNPEELRYLWTAAYAMGKLNPEMKFGPEAIKVVSPAWQPTQEIGTFYGLAKNSLYETVFKGNPGVTQAESFFQESSGHKKPQAQTAKDLSKLSKLFKEDFQTVVAEVSTANTAPAVTSSTPPKLGGT
ncbi:hypothetical protein [Legionella tunisiensis]|uniref:hypothetical protein n=1 Tax=Legionella tunisiensis TaxID=1034944 RepID=UPI00037AC64C|nr:hypothetical protein [Legionella tunisiensis]